MAEAALTDPPESGEEVEEIPSEDGGEPEPTEVQETEETETVSLEEHENLKKRLAYSERKLREKGQEKPAEKQNLEPPVEATQEPKEDDFADYNDFVRALARWETDQRIESREKTNREKTIRDQSAERQRKVDTIVSAELVKDPDFLEKAYIPVGLEELVGDSDQLVDIALYFGKNPQEAIRLLDLPVVQAAREIGRIESKLQTQTPQPRTRTSAPTPTKTVGGNEAVEKGLEDMTTAEHIAHMNKKEFG